MREIKRIYLRRGGCKRIRYLADDMGNIIVQNLTDKQVEQIKVYLNLEIR